MIVFSSFLANVTQARMQMAKLMSKMDKDYWQLRKFCAKNNISRQLTLRIKRYVDQVLVKQFLAVKTTELALLPALSKHLREELQAELLQQKLQVHPLLRQIQGTSPTVIYHIC